MIDFFKKQLFTAHQNGKQQVSEVFKYIGPGIIVTVGFIDPGNWAANLAAGASYGYELLWVVTLSTIMLILLQHNVAHLGIVRGQCLSECAYEFLPRYASRFVLSTAGIAAAATALAEFIGAAIALKMLFGIPILIGSSLTALICTVMLITNSYRKLERIIAGFVSLIALAYLVVFAWCMYLYWVRDAARRYPGLILGWFLTGVFGFRFFVESIKNVQEAWEIDMVLNYGINMGQLLSIPFVIAGVFLIVYSWRHPLQPELITKK